MVTKDQSRKEKAIFLATQARDNAPHYQHSEVGFNYRLSNVCAGIGRGQMEVLDDHVMKRREMHSFYQDIFNGVKEVKIFNEPKNTYFCNYWLTVIRINENSEKEIHREKLRLHLEKYNIESRPLWKPMHLQPAFKDAPFYGKGVAANAFNEGLCLPSGSNLNRFDKQRIADAIQTFFN